MRELLRQPSSILSIPASTILLLPQLTDELTPPPATRHGPTLMYGQGISSPWHSTHARNWDGAEPPQYALWVFLVWSMIPEQVPMVAGRAPPAVPTGVALAEPIVAHIAAVHRAAADEILASVRILFSFAVGPGRRHRAGRHG
jgi:hypothetical protein